MATYSQDKSSELYFSQYGYDFSDEEGNRETAEQIHKLINVSHRKMLVLDMGCGSGLHGDILEKKGYSVVSLDISCRMTKFTHARSKQIMVILADLENLPIKPETIDAVFAFYILHHFPGLENMMKQFSLAVKPGGKIFAVEPNEGNPISKISTLISTSLLKKSMLRSLSEKANEPNFYTEVLSSFGYGNIKIKFLYLCKPILQVQANIVGFLTAIKRILFKLVWKLLPEQYGATDIVLTATLGARAKCARKKVWKTSN